MLDSLYFYGVVAVLLLLALITPVVVMRSRRTTAKLMTSAHMMQSRVYKAVVEKYGVAPNLVAECLTPDGEAIVVAMTRCDRCGSVEECRQFFNQSGSDVDKATKFCPNADLYIKLAEKLS